MESAESLFEQYFLALYPSAEPEALQRLRTEDANPGGNPHIFAQLEAIAETFTKVAPRALGTPSLHLDYSDASVHRLAAALDRDTRDRLLRSASADEPPPLVHLVTHGAVYVGACIVENHGGRWQVRSPLWESLVRLESAAGIGQLALFQWWLKCLSDAEIDEPRLADRYRLLVEAPTFDASTIVPWVPATLRAPRLKEVSYDMLVKYVRKHLPQLKGVGPDFPTPAQFQNLGFKWIELVSLGEGRLVLLHGAADQGVRLFWLAKDGFAGAQFIPADPFVPHRLALEGDKIVIEVPVGSDRQRHEMLWWGPVVSG
ncbi:MAG: hypothetical protein AAGA56_06130 [Myxococcota bacterium]